VIPCIVQWYVGTAVSEQFVDVTLINSLSGSCTIATDVVIIAVMRNYIAL